MFDILFVCFVLLFCPCAFYPPYGGTQTGRTSDRWRGAIRMGNFWRLLGILVLGLTAGWGATAQEVAGSIRGAAVDASGGAVSGASITATQGETGFTRTVASDAQGKFIMIELPVGHYSLQVNAKGFRNFLQEGITLDVNQTAFISVRLAI